MICISCSLFGVFPFSLEFCSHLYTVDPCVGTYMSVVQTTINSRMDYCNSPLTGLLASTLAPLNFNLNTTGRVFLRKILIQIMLPLCSKPQITSHFTPSKSQNPYICFISNTSGLQPCLMK